MKTVEVHNGRNAIEENNANLRDGELGIGAFCQRMSERFHKVWCVNHGEDYKNTKEKQSFHREDYVRS